MGRVKFRKGKQREFLKRVLVEVNCPSLRAFLQFGFDVPYSTLKNYFSEDCYLPEELFFDLCNFSKLNSEDFEFEILPGTWGQIKGGKVGKKLI